MPGEVILRVSARPRQGSERDASITFSFPLNLAFLVRGTPLVPSLRSSLRYGMADIRTFNPPNVVYLSAIMETETP